jgi:predicted nuclease with RNAse H fold
VNYCGIAVGHELQQLCRLEEMRTGDPPIRLRATFYEPGSPAEVVQEIAALTDAVVAVGAPQGEPIDDRDLRVCDAALRRRGVTPRPPLEAGLALFDGLEDLGVYLPEAAADADVGADGEQEGLVEEGIFREEAVFEVNVDAVFCALQGRRVPARRHPLGVLIRIDELTEDRVEDPGGDLWSRRIEEIEAAAAALCAHRYAVGHAAWIGDPEEGVIVLPGSSPPAVFSSEGVIPRVPRARLRGAGLSAPPAVAADPEAATHAPGEPGAAEHGPGEPGRS